MRLTVDTLSVPGPSGRGDLLVGPTSFVAEPGEVTVVTSDPGVPITALALALGGAVTLAAGSVDLWGSTDPRVLQKHVALVDVAGITAPEDALSVRAVVQEQLALARQGSRRRDVQRLMDAHDVRDHSLRWDHVPAGTRTDILLELATRRPATQVIVLAGPDRHGGEARDWYAAAQRTAADVFTVVVLCSADSATHIHASHTARTGAAA